MNGLELAAADLRAIRERVAVVASDLEALADALDQGYESNHWIAGQLRLKVKELGG